MTTSQYSLVSNTYHGQQVDSPLNFNMGEEIIPRYPSLGYDALTHGRAGNGLGYYNVAAAYPSFAGSCSRYGKRVCSGLVEGSSTFRNGHPPHLRSALFQDSGPGPLRNNNSSNNDKPSRSYDANRASPMGEQIDGHRSNGGHVAAVDYSFSSQQAANHAANNPVTASSIVRAGHVKGGAQPSAKLADGAGKFY